MRAKKAPVNSHGILTIDGECDRPRSFSFHDLAGMHDDYQVPDVSKVDARLKGRAVRIRALLDEIGPHWHCKFITIESEDGKFSASLPLSEVRDTGLVVYGMKKKKLEREDGGPVRFIIPFHPDDCTKVKQAVRMSVSEKPGRDTRPSNKREHDAIHADDAK